MDIEEKGSNLQVSTSLIMQISNCFTHRRPPHQRVDYLTPDLWVCFFFLEYLKMSLFGTEF